MMLRLQVVLAQAGVASRRASEELIAAGRIRVNGQVIREQGQKVDPSQDVIEVDGRRIHPREAKVYVLLHKPPGYVSTVRDPRGRRTVLDLVPVAQRIYPVGRLDVDSEGLLLLTNDGEITNYLTHPRYEHEKEYMAQVDGTPSVESLRELRRGVDLGDIITAPATVRAVSQPGFLFRMSSVAVPPSPKTSWLQVTIREGRKRQIRRMLEAVGHPVLRLVRVRMASLALGDLEPGEWRHLSAEELAVLRGSMSAAPSARRGGVRGSGG
jgi:pseudouridine synthase